MIKGKISTGFEFEIDEVKLDDMEFFDALAETDENPLMFSRVCTMMLGAEQKKRLYKHLKTEDGRVPVQSVISAITEIFNYREETKNS